MKLHVLVDNNTIIDRYFLGEPGVSYYIETDNKKIIFDFGYSDIFKKNARKMNIDLTQINTVVLSHGHNDHTGGIKYFLDIMKKNNMEEVKLLAHPQVFDKKIADGEDVGSPYTEKDLKKIFSLSLSKEPQWITAKMVFLGEIPRITDFENKEPIGVFYDETCQVPDFVSDDSAIVYKSERGLVIITGCSHAGICNIIAYAKKICSDNRVCSIIGGMHLLDTKKEILQKAVDFMEKCNIKEIYPCHCTDLNAKITMAKKLPVRDLGVSSIFSYK